MCEYKDKVAAFPTITCSANTMEELEHHGEEEYQKYLDCPCHSAFPMTKGILETMMDKNLKEIKERYKSEHKNGDVVTFKDITFKDVEWLLNYIDYLREKLS